MIIADIEQYRKAKAQFENLEALIASPAHGIYKVHIQAEIDTCEAALLRVPPLTPEDQARMLVVHGSRSAYLDLLSLFESSRDELKTALTAWEAENQVPQA